jgi:hypothetical protein
LADRVVPVKVVEDLARQEGLDLDARSVLIGYLFGRAATEDRRLLTDPDHLRAWLRPILRRYPGEPAR